MEQFEDDPRGGVLAHLPGPLPADAVDRVRVVAEVAPERVRRSVEREPGGGDPVRVRDQRIARHREDVALGNRLRRGTLQHLGAAPGEFREASPGRGHDGDPGVAGGELQRRCHRAPREGQARTGGRMPLPGSRRLQVGNIGSSMVNAARGPRGRAADAAAAGVFRRRRGRRTLPILPPLDIRVIYVI